MMSRTRSSSPESLALVKTGNILSTAIPRMPNRVVLMVLLLVSGLWPQLASSAPTPQNNQADVPAGQQNDDFDVQLNKDSASELRYSWLKSVGAELTDIPDSHNHPDGLHRNPHSLSSAPTIHIIDNDNTFDPFTFFRDNQLVTPPPTPPPIPQSSSPPFLARTITPRHLEDKPEVKTNLDSDSNKVFNIIVQQQRTQRSAFIAPDVNWLRDLVPRVVDVVDKSELQIKETIFSAFDDQTEAGNLEDRQVFVNVVKSTIQSEDEVPKILSHLKEMMQTGGPTVDSMLAESRDGSVHRRYLVINIIIFNVIIGQNSTSKPVETLKPATFTRDSYLEALEESQKNRQGSTANKEQNGPHFSDVVIADQPDEQSGTPFFFRNHPDATERPMTVMEKDYARPIQPAEQSVDNDDNEDFVEEELIDEEPVIAEEEEPPFYADLSEVETSSVNTPEPEVVIVQPVRRPARKPGKIPVKTKNPRPVNTPAPRPNRIPAAVSALTQSAGNAMRNRVRTIGFVAVPLMAGLAGTVNMWLPAVAAFGRKKRSVDGMEEMEEIDWEHPDNRERAKAIEDESVLALLMGKRYMNATKASLQESIDNWKNRDQDSPSSPSSIQIGLNRLASTSRPQWVRYPTSQRTTTTPTEGTHTTVKRSTDAITTPPVETKTTTRRSIFPSFYSALFNKNKEEKIEEEVQNREDVDFEPSSAPDNYEITEGTVRELDPNPSTTSSYIPQSPGFDFDIVANFVKSTLSKMVTDSGAENREEIFLIKSPSIVNSTSSDSSSLLYTNEPSRVTSNVGSTLSVFTAQPLMPSWVSENQTNSPVTYLSIQPAKNPVTTSTTTTAELNFEEDDSASDLPGSETVGAPVEFFEDESGNLYVTKDSPSPTVPFSEPFVKSTSKPLPSQSYISPFELPGTLRPENLLIRSTTTGSSRPTTSNTIRTTTKPGTTRPSTLITIDNFKTSKPPPSVDVSSTVTTLKFNHNGIVTSPPLQDFSTYTGESSLVSDTVDKQNILAGLLKGASSSSVPLEGINSNSDFFVLTNRPASNSDLGETGSDWNGATSSNMYGSSTFNTATYDPFSTTGISDELDVSSVITQLQTNLSTGLVTKSPAGLHFVNTSTDIVIINPFDVTPSTIFSPFDIEAVVAEDETTEDSISVDADFDVPANFVESVPQVDPSLANLFFISSSSGGSSSSGSSSSSDGSGSSSSVSLGAGLTSATGISSLAVLSVLGLAAAAIFALTLPVWVPFIGKKKRRTYGPSKKTYKPPKKSYGHPTLKKTYGEPPPNHYKDLDERTSLDDLELTDPIVVDLYHESDSPSSSYSSTNVDDLYNDPGPLNSEDIYGPPATVFLNARRRRRSASRPSRFNRKNYSN